MSKINFYYRAQRVRIGRLTKKYRPFINDLALDVGWLSRQAAADYAKKIIDRRLA